MVTAALKRVNADNSEEDDMLQHIFHENITFFLIRRELAMPKRLFSLLKLHKKLYKPIG